jgi:hypothetical protein
MRFHTDLMIGHTQLVPARNVEHGRGGWWLYNGTTPEGQPDPDHVWVVYDHPQGGATRVHESNVRYTRYWWADDPAMPETLKPPTKEGKAA